MEREIMFRIYNTLFDSKKELGIDNLEIYTNLEMNLCVKYTYKDPEENEEETYVICNDLIERGALI